MLDCMYKYKAVKTEIYIVDSSATPLLSLKTSLDLGLIQLTHSVDHSVDGLDQSSNGLDKKLSSRRKKICSKTLAYCLEHVLYTCER